MEFLEIGAWHPDKPANFVAELHADHHAPGATLPDSGALLHDESGAVIGSAQLIARRPDGAVAVRVRLSPDALAARPALRTDLLQGSLAVRVEADGLRLHRQIAPSQFLEQAASELARLLASQDTAAAPVVGPDGGAAHARPLSGVRGARKSQGTPR